MRVHYCIHNSQPLYLILMNPVHTLADCYVTIHFNIVFPAMSGLPNSLSPSSFTRILYTFQFPMHAACLANLMLLDITLTIVRAVRLLIMPFSSPSSYFLPLRSRFPPQCRAHTSVHTNIPFVMGITSSVTHFLTASPRFITFKRTLKNLSEF
jgi:hypothetical protein